MNARQRASLPFALIALAIVACVVPGVGLVPAPVDPNANATVVAQTVLAIVEMTQRAEGTGLVASETATATSTGSPTPLPTLTPTYTLTPTTTSTVVPLVPMISVSVPTNCRVGPGKIYRMVGALLVGETAQVFARDPTGHYWLIRNPDDPANFCWIWDQYATVTGLYTGLPVYTPPPTPTATFTATPAPGFDADFATLESCSGHWWVRIELHNTGTVTFRSIQMSVKDLATNAVVSLEDDGFSDQTGCNATSTRNTLGPNRSFTQSSHKFSYSPNGHRLRATIELCSQTGMNGRCVKRTITFRP